MNDLGTLVSLIVVVILISYLYTLVESKIENLFSKIIEKISNFILIGILITGYIANLNAVYNHWSDPLSLGILAEFIGVIIFPLGIVTGWIHIFN